MDKLAVFSAMFVVMEEAIHAADEGIIGLESLRFVEERIKDILRILGLERVR